MSSTFATTPVAASALNILTVRDAAKHLLAKYAEQPGDAVTWQELLAFRRELAALVAAISARKKESPESTEAIELVHLFAGSGVLDYPVETEDLALVEKYRTGGWPGLLACMLLVPAWQWSGAPRFDDVPTWLWPIYTAYVFYTPQGFCAPGQSNAFVAHYVRRLPELVRLAELNRGSSAVRAMLMTYQKFGNCVPLYFSEGSLRQHYELRARALTILCGVGPQDEPFMSPRDGRRLRIGFINRHFAPQTETYTTLPSFEMLDPERFEVILFAHNRTDTPLENYAREKVSEFRLLPAEIDAQVQILRDAALDVAVFGTNVTAVFNEVTRLALYRVAPCQIINNSSCTTSGMPHADIYVSGKLTEGPEAPAHFSERLALLPGPTHSFDYEADKQEPSQTFTRATFGFPEDATVFVTAANYYKIIPEMQEQWAQLLAAVPGSRLLVHPFNPNWSSSYPIKRFCAEFDRVLAKHGVSSDRLAVSSMKFPSRTDVAELMRVGDIYLDTFPFAGVNSLVDPLEAGIPTVAWEGATFRSRMAAGLLRSLGLDELIATDAASYQAIALRLAKDTAWRDALKVRIQEKMTRTPEFLDMLASSDSFGALVENVYDELYCVGREEFRKDRTPIAVPVPADPAALIAEGSSLLEAGLAGEATNRAWQVLGALPNSPEARHLMGRALLAQGRMNRAVDYLLAAVQHAESNAALWQDLAIALRRSDRITEALQALEVCVRVDEKRLESWLMLGEWSLEANNPDMANEVVKLLQQLAPDDARVLSLAARVGPI